uniref:Uncharacterized protein n=1 Tax=Arundo donax TaxID=35708 RepID=A0A0A9AM12_ARUDO
MGVLGRCSAAALFRRNAACRVGAVMPMSECDHGAGSSK